MAVLMKIVLHAHYKDRPLPEAVWLHLLGPAASGNIFGTLVEALARLTGSATNIATSSIHVEAATLMHQGKPHVKGENLGRNAREELAVKIIFDLGDLNGGNVERVAAFTKSPKFNEWLHRFAPQLEIKDWRSIKVVVKNNEGARHE